MITCVPALAVVRLWRADSAAQTNVWPNSSVSLALPPLAHAGSADSTASEAHGKLSSLARPPAHTVNHVVRILRAAAIAAAFNVSHQSSAQQRRMRARRTRRHQTTRSLFCRQRHRKSWLCGRFVARTGTCLRERVRERQRESESERVRVRERESVSQRESESESERGREGERERERKGELARRPGFIRVDTDVAAGIAGALLRDGRKVQIGNARAVCTGNNIPLCQCLDCALRCRIRWVDQTRLLSTARSKTTQATRSKRSVGFALTWVQLEAMRSVSSQSSGRAVVSTRCLELIRPLPNVHLQIAVSDLHPIFPRFSFQRSPSHTCSAHPLLA